ncbi:MAG: hypothetical protein IKN53_00385 [Oscillibacter sp.]|nr:hypothetical protein [Oscillibacter sp.]
MKKILALALAALTLLALAACGAKTEAPAAAPNETQTEEAAQPSLTDVVGGWTPAAEFALTDEKLAVFDKALEGLVGVNYVPVAYLGSQVVAGTNHCFLAQATAVVPNAEPYYVFVYAYEALDGSVELMNIADFDVGALCTYGA